MRYYLTSKTYPSRFKSPRGSRRRGLQLLELAFVMPMLLFLTIGLFQYGLIYNAVGTIGNITRAGARYAAIHAADSKTIYNGTSMDPDAAIRAYVRSKTKGTPIDPTDLPDSAIAISPTQSETGRNSGQPITVTITYDLNNRMFVKGFPVINLMVKKPYVSAITHMIE